MKRLVAPPFVCLITSGETNPENFEIRKRSILNTVHDAVDDGVNLVQIREKILPGKLLFDLAKEVVGVLENTRALVLINDRADVAVAAGADGVHLPEASMSPSIVRRAFGNDLVIGVSTHSVAAAIETSESGANYLFFGPVFATPGKNNPVGLDALREVRKSVGSFPVIALGGVDDTNAEQVFATGIAGIAAIRALHEPDSRRAICKTAEAFNATLG